MRSGLKRLGVAALGLVTMAAMPVMPVMAAELPSFTVEMKDGVVTPNRIEVPAGQTFKIIVSNAGTGPAEFESLRLHQEKVLAVGVKSFIVIRGLSAGKYPFFDDFYSDLKTAHGVIVAK